MFLRFTKMPTTPPCGLMCDILALHMRLVAQRQHDRTNHGDQQDQAGQLEQQQVVGVHHLADRLGVVLGARIGIEAVGIGAARESGERNLCNEGKANQRSKGQIAQKALFQLDEIDVEHHDHEEEKHGDGTDIDDDQQHGEEFSADQHHQACRGKEGQDQPEHRVHRVLRGDHTDCRHRDNRGQNVEGDQFHRFSPKD